MGTGGREGVAMGSSHQQVQVTWPPLSHTYQAVSSGLVCSENAMAVQIRCRQLEAGSENATRRWVPGVRRAECGERACWCPHIFAVLLSQAWMWNPICVILLPIIMLHWGSEMVSGCDGHREQFHCSSFICAEELPGKCLQMGLESSLGRRTLHRTRDGAPARRLSCANTSALYLIYHSYLMDW